MMAFIMSFVCPAKKTFESVLSVWISNLSPNKTVLLHLIQVSIAKVTLYGLYIYIYQSWYVGVSIKCDTIKITPNFTLMEVLGE